MYSLPAGLSNFPLWFYNIVAGRAYNNIVIGICLYNIVVNDVSRYNIVVIAAAGGGPGWPGAGRGLGEG